MSEVKIRIPTPLRSHAGGVSEVTVEAETVESALRELGDRHEGLLRYVLDEDGGLRRFVNVFVGDRDVRNLDGLQTGLEPGAVISIVPAVAGGGR